MTERAAYDPIAIALRVAAAIEAVGGAYFVGGSVASSLQGDPRSTNDIDFVLSLPWGRVDALAQALGPDFEVDREVLAKALRERSTANAFYLPMLTKLDFFALGDQPFDESEFSRRRAVAVGPAGQLLVIKSPEDSVVRKLLWFREGGEVSERQWRDVVAILRVNGAALDRAYLCDWSLLLRCHDLLERAWQEVRTA